MRIAIVRVIVLAAIAIALVSPAGAGAAPPKFGTVLYGASYYWEYMPVERLEQDVRLMEKLGITFVRLGESTWGVMEPRDGEFDFAWLDRVIDRQADDALQVDGKPESPQPVIRLFHLDLIIP